SQVSALGALFYTGVDGVAKTAAEPVHVLSDFEEHDRHAAVLAHGQLLGGGDLVVGDELPERPTSERRFLRRQGAAQTIEHVRRYPIVRLDEAVGDRRAHRIDVNMSYGGFDAVHRLSGEIHFRARRGGAGTYYEVAGRSTRSPPDWSGSN